MVPGLKNAKLAVGTHFEQDERLQRGPSHARILLCPVGLRVHSFLSVKRPFSASKDGAYNNVVVWLHGVGEEVRTDGIFKVFVYACLPFETH